MIPDSPPDGAMPPPPPPAPPSGAAPPPPPAGAFSALPTAFSAIGPVSRASPRPATRSCGLTSSIAILCIGAPFSRHVPGRANGSPPAQPASSSALVPSRMAARPCRLALRSPIVVLIAG
ncbi:MAG: hypothetical protein B7Z59_04565 [Acidiphilium sp. 37-67-22]|nr:MAG: hypothetical protein B7Z59_04565 [Acidiphilium sp. 37-67-22]